MKNALRGRRWIGLSAGLSLATATAFAVRRRRVSRRIQGYRSRITEGTHPPTSEPYDPSTVADLPAPVRRYFETVLQEGQRSITRVKLAQEGHFRFGGAEARWYSFTASQVYTVSPPMYVWDARVELNPLVSVRVLDSYIEGEGMLRANLFGGVPVASAGPSPQMNEAELQRYLAETPWFPTALLPAAGVFWTSIDDQTARATIEDGAASATATFHFDEEGYVTRLTADRYRQDTDSTAPWTGYYRTYEEHEGMQIPTEAEVGWDTPNGVEPYWRGTITDIDYWTGQ